MSKPSGAKQQQQQQQQHGSPPPVAHRLVQSEHAKTILLNVPLARPSKTGPTGVNPKCGVSRQCHESPGPSSGVAGGASGRRVRSASAGRDRKRDLQARYWAFLFENLRRAVDDIYHTCEAEDSVPAAKEVILVLENYVRDFRNLVDWLRLKWDYENTPPPQRPTSLAWEVRKTSPAAAKLSSASFLGLGRCQQRLTSASPAKRSLQFDDVRDAEREVDITSDASNPTAIARGPSHKEAGRAEEKENEDPKMNTIHEESKLSTPEETLTQKVGKVGEGQTKKKADVANEDESKSKPNLTMKSRKAVENQAKESQTAVRAVSAPTASSVSKSVQRIRPNTPSTSSTTANASSGNKTPVQQRSSSTRTQPATFASKLAVAKKESGAKEVSNKNTLERAKTIVDGNTNANIDMEKSLAKSSEGKTATAKTTEKNSDKASQAPGKKSDRVSLVARQSRVSGSGTSAIATTGGTVRGLNFTRSATISAISKTSGKAGATLVKSNSTASNRPTSSKTPLTQSISSGAVTVSEKVSSPQQQQTVPPFGSTSSISSSSSCRSWADTVKGLKTPKSVDCSRAEDDPDNDIQVNGIVAEEEQGWETVVRPRARSKYSPISQRIANGSSVRSKFSKSAHSVDPSVITPSTGSKAADKRPIAKRDSLDSGLKVRHSAKTRFEVPSAAISLPSLALMKEDAAKDEDACKPTKEKSSHPSNTRKAEASSSKRSSSQLDKVLETKSNASSNESLSTNASSERKRGAIKKAAASDCNTSSAQLRRPVGFVTTSTKNISRKATSSETVRSKSASKKGSSIVKSNLIGRKKKSSTASPTSTSPASSLQQLDTSDDDGTDNAIAQTDAAIAKAEEEEENLARQILETEKEELPSDGCTTTPSSTTSVTPTTPFPLGDSLTVNNAAKMTPSKYKRLLESGALSWAEQVDLEEQLESRYPGRAIQLHEKLSSPARKKEPQEAFREHQEKQRLAKIRREKFQDEKAAKLSALNAKIEVVIAQKYALLTERKKLYQGKMKRAEEKRQQYIDGIRRRAHEEDAKLKEIAFINELQAQNARIDMLAHKMSEIEKHEERMAEMAEERARKVEEREAKEARAEKNRRDLEEKRLRNMRALKEKIKTREERILEEQEQQRKDREEAAREKARDREEKLSSVRNAEKDQKTELQEKIAQKQEDAAKRHKEKLEKIRRKAFELSVQRCSTDEGVPQLQAFDVRKKCDICNVIICNEVHLQSHLRGKLHIDKVLDLNNGRKLSGEEIQSCNLVHIVDAKEDEPDPKVVQAKERARTMKKRAKKIKAKIVSKTLEYEKTVALNPSKSDAPNRAKIGKSLKDIEKLIGGQGKGSWPNNAVTQLERALGEISRALDKTNSSDKMAFFHLGGFTTLFKIFSTMTNQKSNCSIPLKNFVTCCKTWGLACRGHKHNLEYVLKSNHLTTLVDILVDRFRLLLPSSSDEEFDCGSLAGSGPQVDSVASAIMCLLAQVFEDLSEVLRTEGKTVEKCKSDDLSVRVLDQVSYIVSIGMVDMVAKYLNVVQDPIDNKVDVGSFLLSAMQLLSSLTGVAEVLVKPPVDPKASPSDPTHLLAAFRVTDLAGTVSMLYGILLHAGAPARTDGNGLRPPPSPPRLPSHTRSVAVTTCQLLARLVRQHLSMVQEVLGQEGISLEFRHIASHLLWYCQHHEETERKLLHLAIILVGYFAARHPDNQAIVQSGHQPSVLQRLCNLPFAYFSQPELKLVLFPTLIAASHLNKANKDVVTEELSYQLLEDFMVSDSGAKNHLVQLVLSE